MYYGKSAGRGARLARPSDRRIVDSIAGGGAPTVAGASGQPPVRHRHSGAAFPDLRRRTDPGRPDRRHQGTGPRHRGVRPPRRFRPEGGYIVRVEAGKLRKRLEEYYADEGSAAAVRIEIPKGSYVPQFPVVAPTPALVVPAAAAAPRHRYAAGITALLLVAAGLWGAWRFRVPAAPVNPSIAVLRSSISAPIPAAITSPMAWRRNSPVRSLTRAAYG